MASALWRSPVFRCLLLLLFCAHASQGELLRAAWHRVTLNGFWSAFQKATFYSGRECFLNLLAHILCSPLYMPFSALYALEFVKGPTKKKRSHIWMPCYESQVMHGLSIVAFCFVFISFWEQIWTCCARNDKVPHLSCVTAGVYSDMSSARHWLISSPSVLKSHRKSNTPATIQSRVSQNEPVRNLSSFWIVPGLFFCSLPCLWLACLAVIASIVAKHTHLLHAYQNP